MIDDKKLSAMWKKIMDEEIKNTNTDSKDSEMVKRLMFIIEEELDKCY